MPVLDIRDYNEAAAKAAYIENLNAIAAGQNLSEDTRDTQRRLSIAFTVMAVFFVGLRFVARFKQGVRISWDDWIILVALVLLFGDLTFNLVLINQGVGLHSGAVSLANQQAINETVVGAEIIYVVSVTMYKISLLFLYVRTFPVTSVKKGAYICGGLATSWTTACIFAATFQCTPRNKLWEPWLQGTCIDLFLTQLCISVPTILIDVAILALPIPHVWRLQMTKWQKVLITGMFLLGSFVVFTSCYRFVIFLGYTSDDITYSLAPGLSWNLIEVSSGIISACLPALGPLVKLVITSLYPSSLKRSSNGPSSGRQNTHELVTIGGTGGQVTPGQSGTKWSQGRNRDPRLSISDESTEEMRAEPASSSKRIHVRRSFRISSTTDIKPSANSSNDQIPLTSPTSTHIR